MNPSSIAQPVQYDDEILYELETTYLSKKKAWPYVGNSNFLKLFVKGSRHYYNSLAVFPFYERKKMHGYLGVSEINGTRLYKRQPKPDPNVWVTNIH